VFQVLVWPTQHYEHQHGYSIAWCINSCKFITLFGLPFADGLAALAIVSRASGRTHTCSGLLIACPMGFYPEPRPAQHGGSTSLQSFTTPPSSQGGAREAKPRRHGRGVVAQHPGVGLIAAGLYPRTRRPTEAHVGSTCASHAFRSCPTTNPDI
jgi:hypothetical protein